MGVIDCRLLNETETSCPCFSRCDYNWKKFIHWCINILQEDFTKFRDASLFSLVVKCHELKCPVPFAGNSKWQSQMESWKPGFCYLWKASSWLSIPRNSEQAHEDSLKGGMPYFLGQSILVFSLSDVLHAEFAERQSKFSPIAFSLNYFQHGKNFSLVGLTVLSESLASITLWCLWTVAGQADRRKAAGKVGIHFEAIEVTLMLSAFCCLRTTAGNSTSSGRGFKLEGKNL